MRRTAIVILVGIWPLLVAGRASAQSFRVTETSIGEIHQAMQSGTLTCHALVEQYLNPFAKSTSKARKLNAMLYVNPNALQQADAKDEEFKRSGKLKPLGCIPDRLEKQSRYSGHADNRGIDPAQGIEAGEGRLRRRTAAGERRINCGQSQPAGICGRWDHGQFARRANQKSV